MSAEFTKEQIYFLFPEGIENMKKNKNTVEIEMAIRNVEMLQRPDNTLDFIQIEAESMEIAVKEQDLDTIFRLLPVFLSDIKRLIGKGKQ